MENGAAVEFEDPSGERPLDIGEPDARIDAEAPLEGNDFVDAEKLLLSHQARFGLVQQPEHKQHVSVPFDQSVSSVLLSVSAPDRFSIVMFPIGINASFFTLPLIKPSIKQSSTWEWLYNVIENRAIDIFFSFFRPVTGQVKRRNFSFLRIVTEKVTQDAVRKMLHYWKGKEGLDPSPNVCVFHRQATTLSDFRGVHKIITDGRVHVADESAKVVQGHAEAVAAAEQQAVGALGGAALVQQQLLELLLLLVDKLGVDRGQHHVQQEVHGDQQVGHEEDGRNRRRRVRWHHHVRVTVGRPIQKSNITGGAGFSFFFFQFCTNCFLWNY